MRSRACGPGQVFLTKTHARDNGGVIPGQLGQLRLGQPRFAGAHFA